MSPTFYDWLTLLAAVALALGLLSCLYILADQRRRPRPAMKVMLWVWPVNALWSGPLGIWAYRALGQGKLPPVEREAVFPQVNSAGDAPQTGMTGDMKQDGTPGGGDMRMDMHKHMPARPFWQKVAVGTLHCGAGCTLADLAGPWLFRVMPFSVAGNLMYGEWTLDYLLALLFGVAFQYAGLAAMVPERGAALWWRAFKVDFFSLTAWQVGMYGWMAVAVFGLFGPLPPTGALFWFMMQISMACGFMTAYPMNWLLIRIGIKKAM